MVTTKRQKLEIMRNQMELERTSFIPHWKDLNDFINPRRGRFFLSDVNKGDRRNQNIIDSTATIACRNLASAFMSGITSPSRPWFKVTTPDPDLADYPRVKEWLNIVETRMATVFNRSNLYKNFPSLYGDLATFGTPAMLVEEDFDKVINTNTWAVGSFCIATDSRGLVNTAFREFRMTVRQLVDTFGRYDNGEPDWSVFSDYVKNQYERGNYQTWIDVCHFILPNDDYDQRRPQAKFKQYSSIYYERGGTYIQDSNYDKYLRESGYDRFPVLAPRWEVTGEDTYATNCPGMTTLGDVKALQIMHKFKSKAIQKMVDPAMVGPTRLANVASTIIPGGITYLDETTDAKFRPAHEVNIRLNELMLDIQDHEQRIKRGYFEDIVLMVTDLDRRQITATEIDERKQEKLLVLGPVLEQLNQDCLDPLIDITFDIMLKQGMFPPPPPELEGVDLKIEYVSVMAQAQKLVGMANINTFTQYIGNLAQFDPSVISKINRDELVNVVADITSVPPKIVFPDEVAQQSRNAQAQAMANEQKAANMQAMAGTAKQLSETDMSGESALNKILGNA